MHSQTQALNRALFDQVKGFESFNSLLDKYKAPETAAQASTTVAAAGFDVTGMDSTAIAAYVTRILNGDGMKNAAGELTAYGLATVAALNGVTGSLDTLGEAAANAAELLNSKLDLQAQIYELTGNKLDALTVREQQRAIELANMDESLRGFQTTLWGLQDAFGGVDDALDAVQRAIDAQKTSIQDRAGVQIAAIQRSIDSRQYAISAAQESITVLTGIFDDIAAAGPRLHRHEPKSGPRRHHAGCRKTQRRAVRSHSGQNRAVC